MADKFLLKLKLAKQGVIKGSSTKKEGGLDFSTGLECQAFEYGVTSQYNVGTGSLTGRRTHKPITIVRETDSASPLLWSALVTNESIVTATLQFGRPTDGKLSVHQTIELTNGAIVKYETFHSGGQKYERFALSYQGVTVNGIANGVIHPT